jgi:hypothetical protein
MAITLSFRRGARAGWGAVGVEVGGFAITSVKAIIPRSNPHGSPLAAELTTAQLATAGNRVCVASWDFQSFCLT